MYAFNDVITDFTEWYDFGSCWMMKYKCYALTIYCNIKNKMADYLITK